MLIRFAVANYSSFKEQQIFSMAAGKHTRHPSHFINIDGKRLLKSSFIFGANASGKSNFVHAIDFMRRMVLRGVKSIRYTDRFFRVDAAYKEKPGEFQADFLFGNTCYSYGFSFHYLTHEISAEWLYRIESPEKETCIFEREIQQPIRTDLKLGEKAKTKFSVYSEDLNPNELFLSVISKKRSEENSELQDFVNAYRWFQNLVIVYPESHFKNRQDYFLNPDTDNHSLPKLLQDFDTGIEGIEKGKQSLEKALSFLPEDEKKEMLDRIEQDIHGSLKEDESVIVSIDRSQFELSIEDGEMVANKIMLNHGNPSELFELVDESDGTQRLFDLLPLYSFGQKERVLIVDELDRSFHSKLTQEFVRRFFEKTKDKPSQLICTTHDLNLMDTAILRQDEIWFVEREPDHSSRMYSLSDYRQRFDKNILNDYLLGRYGAIPFFREDQLSEEEE